MKTRFDYAAPLAALHQKLAAASANYEATRNLQEEIRSLELVSQQALANQQATAVPGYSFYCRASDLTATARALAVEAY